MDAIVISDIHLGADNCQDKKLIDLLKKIHYCEISTQRLILNGDVFDSHDFRRLKKRHWKVLSLLRKLSNDIEVIWICGNHDGPAEVVSHLLGLIVVDEFILQSGDKNILCLHGHQFDKFLDEHPILTYIGDFIYFLLQRIDNSHYFARLAKQNSKTWVHCVEQIQSKSMKYAAKKNCDVVCCGHSHHAIITDKYVNSGCWTENPCTYLTICNGVIDLVSV